MERNEIIVELYFIKKKKQIDIAEKLNISNYKYDYKTKSYKLKSNVVTTYDIPKKLNGNTRKRLSYI